MRLGASAEERFGTKHINPVHFRGEAYPSNFEFYHDCKDGPLGEWVRVGLAPAFIQSMNPNERGKIIHKDQVLVWTQGMVVSMSKERFKKKRKRKF